MHIAWLILKIILLTLGILLGIAVILLLLVLFVPVRYQVDAICHPEADARGTDRECHPEADARGTDRKCHPEVKARVSWMSFFLDLRAQYSQSPSLRLKGRHGKGEFLYYLRSFWVLLATNDESKYIKKKDVDEKQKSRKKKQKRGSKKQALEKEDRYTDTEDIPVIDTRGLQDFPSFQEDFEPWEADVSEEADGVQEETSSLWDYIRRFFKGLEIIFTLPVRIVVGIHFVWSKLRTVMDHFRDSLKRLLKKLKQIDKKRTQIVKLWGLPTTKTALKNTKGYVLDLLKHLKPKKLSGRLIIGCKDPAMTGQIFGILGLLLPIYYDSIDIAADFEHARVEGDIHMRGSITVFYLLCLLLKIYMDKYTMKTYERIKKILGGN